MCMKNDTSVNGTTPTYWSPIDDVCKERICENTTFAYSTTTGVSEMS